MNASEKWFRLLLRFYPADFRDEMGEALVETYIERSHETSLAALWLIALWDSLRNGLGERLRPAITWRRTGDWGRDLELVSRRLRQKPMFVVAVLATLAVGLGVFAVVFTAVDKILLEPLPYRNPRDLYMIWSKVGTLPHLQVTGPAIAELEKAGGVIDGASGFQFTSATLPADKRSDAARLSVIRTSASLFDLLGVRPALGRSFQPADEGPDAPPVVMLSDGLWKRLGADPAIVGGQLKTSRTSYTVIGVMPPDFRFSASFSSPSLQPDIYIPFPLKLAAEHPTDDGYLAVIRGRHGASPEQVAQAVDAVGRFVDERDTKQGRRLFPVGLQKELVEEVRPALVAMSFAAAFLVIVLTLNLASLLLARAAERERQFAVSRALGAGGAAVVRATLVEGGVLGFFGGIAGTIAGAWGTKLLVALGPLDLPRREALAMDWGIGLLVIVVGLLLGLIAAAVPATWAARASLASLLSGIAVRGSASSGRLRRALIVTQIALSLVLLSAGGLVIRSFQQLLAADPGFRPNGVLTFNFVAGSALFPKIDDAYSFQDRVDAALRALPGVIAVSAANQLPLSGGGNAPGVSFPDAPGNTGDPRRDRLAVSRIFVRAGYVSAIGMRLREGRDFDPTRREGVREALIDRRLAQQFFPNGGAIGAHFLCNGEAMTIVGVVDQARLSHLHQDDDHPHLYVRAEDFGSRPNYYVVRTNRDPRTLIPDVRAAIRRIDSRAPISDVRTMDEIIADKRSRERMSAVLIGGLGLGALLLVSVGLFGVISGSVERRRGELAVRMALGGTRGRVIRLVVGEGARLIAFGMLIGIPGVYLAGEALRGFLIGVSPFDGFTLAGVAIGLAVVALLACCLAARRVTAIEPSCLLREGG